MNGANENIRLQIRVFGIVQGVGFRPTIYRLAIERQLSGLINNNGEGVYIEVEGPQTVANDFVQAVQNEAPPLSRIDRLMVKTIAQRYDTSFVIAGSDSGDLTSISVSPDKGVCPECLKDTLTPCDRHAFYPFTNCTHCGPRYSLIRALPYDRKNTSMADFVMCPDCETAYNNPLDRRYHAQPVSCNRCGPQVQLKNFQDTNLACRQGAIEAASTAIKAGKIVAVKGIGGFHLMCDGANAEVVNRLRSGKRRYRKPLAVMMKTPLLAKDYVVGSELEWQLLESPERPIVLFQKKQPAQNSGLIADSVAPGIPYLGVMLPYTPLHHLLLDSINTPVVATSANLSGQPIVTEYQEVLEKLSSVADLILDHNRTIVHPCDDSLVQVVGGRRQTLRLGRGYAPLVMPLSEPVTKRCIALGAQQKTSIAFASGNQMIIGPYIGDLDSIDMQQRYNEVLDATSNLYQISPEQTVCDQHPAYVTTEIASQQLGSICQIQHHHAHILSVMAENNLTTTVLGFTFDGTGYGSGQTGEAAKIWGGEVFLADVHSAQRCGHLKPFRLIGGERAIKEPWRILLGLLLEYYTLPEIRDFNLKAFRHVTDVTLDNLYRVWQNPQASPLTTSMGRLIDAWASLLDLVQATEYDGECGMQLEAWAKSLPADASPSNLRFDLNNEGVFNPAMLLDKAISNYGQKHTAEMAAVFLRAIAYLIHALAERYPDYPIAVAGGVFQNRFLMDCLADFFNTSNRQLLTTEKIPVNDGGIAAGQLWHGIFS